MKKYLYILIAFFFSYGSQAQYDPDALAVLNSMSEKYKAMGPYSADFTQELINESAGINDKIDGSIVVSEDMYVLKVAGQEIYNNGTDVFSYSEEIEEVTVSTYEPEEQEITLGNIYDLYKDGFKYVLMGVNQKGDRMVELDPESKDKSYFKIKLVIDKNDELNRFTVMERSGNQYVYSIKSLEKKPSISEAYFTFDDSKYPDVEIIDFR